MRPLVDAGMIPADFPLTATSLTGYSGGGRKMIEQYETSGDPRLTSPRPYALNLHHKHMPEMQAHAGLSVPPVFMPVVGNFYKGLAVSIEQIDRHVNWMIRRSPGHLDDHGKVEAELQRHTRRKRDPIEPAARNRHAKGRS